MRFSVRKRRTAPAVIIVALIDVLVVLLIFLMVTTTFKQQPALKLALPESSAAQKTGAEENFLEVSIDADGNFRFDKAQVPQTLDQLRGQLLARAAKDPDLKLTIRADKKAPWFRIVNVMDIARAAHIKTLSAVTKDAAKP
jgi:biopolymer transport protein ExbD